MLIYECIILIYKLSDVSEHGAMEDSELKEFSSALKNNLIGIFFFHFTFFHFSAIVYC